MLPAISKRRLLSKLTPAWQIALLCGVVCLGYYILYRTAIVGVEHSPEQEQRYLVGQFRERFKWEALPAASVERVWANGFREHIYLYRIRLAPDTFADLRRTVLATQGDDITSNDTDDLGLCPFGFATNSPKGPKGMRLPAWWEVGSLRRFDSLLWHSVRSSYWFCYDTDRQILFLLVY